MSEMKQFIATVYCCILQFSKLCLMVFEQHKSTCSEDIIVAKAQYIGNILYVKGNEVESEFYVAVMTILKP